MNLGSEMIINRDEAREIEGLKGWILIYGRRKVGKTFLIKNFLHHDVYFRVGRDGKISAEKFPLDEINDLRGFSSAVLSLLERGKTVVIDEFQRLPDNTLENISTAHPSGRAVFCGSSMRVIKKIFGRRSPLLGLVREYKLGLVKPRNILRELLKRMSPAQAVELAPFLSDVWTLPFFEAGRRSLETIYRLLRHSRLTIPALVGEIFTEEERELTRTYEGILRSIGAGEWDYRRVAVLLAGRGLIERADSSLVLPYIKNLVGMGLVEELPIYGSKKKMYRLASPVMEAFYYLCDRYDFEETDVSFREVKPTLERLRNLAIQDWVADLFAEVYQGRKEYLMAAGDEVDFVITLRGKPLAMGEVKWGRYGRGDIEGFKRKVEPLKGQKFFVTREKTGMSDEGIRVVDAGELAKLCTGATRAE